MAKERSPVRVLIYSIITLGIYGIYWTYQALKQVLADKDASPVLWFIGLLVPLVNFYILWKFCGEVEEYSGGEQSGPLLFLLYLVFAPAAIYLVQKGLNQGLTQ